MKNKFGRFLKWLGRRIIGIGMRLDPPQTDHLFDSMWYSSLCFAKPDRYAKADENKDSSDE